LSTPLNKVKKVPLAWSGHEGAGRNTEKKSGKKQEELSTKPPERNENNKGRQDNAKLKQMAGLMNIINDRTKL